jgi:hypothetical protein
MRDDDTPTSERAAIGEVLAACPRCGLFDPRETNQGRYACAGCGLRFPAPVYFQRVVPPSDLPADPPSARTSDGLTRDEIEAVLAARRPPPPDPAA